MDTVSWPVCSGARFADPRIQGINKTDDALRWKVWRSLTVSTNAAMRTPL